MADRIVRALIPGANLMTVTCVATDAAREGRQRHGLAASSAQLLGQGLAAASMLAALQKAEKTRINLQIECEGPVRGLLVDADTQGNVRGYIRNKTVSFPGQTRFSAKPLLGSKGYVSVLRDIDGQFYRGSVGLEQHDVSLDLEHYFQRSEQVDTALQLEVLAEGDEELGWVGGLLVQRLPDGDEWALAELREKLRQGAVEQAVRGGATTAHALVEAVVGRERLDLLSDQDVRYSCHCSKDRVVRALCLLTNLDLIEMIEEDKQANIDCDFCGAHYHLTEQELRDVLDVIDQRDAEKELKAAQRRANEGLN